MRTIRDCLMKMDHLQLYELGFRLLVEPFPKGTRRERWYETLETALQSDDLNVQLCLPLVSWQAVRSALDKEGAEDGTLCVALRAARRGTELGDALMGLKRLGLAWRDKHAWYVLPQVRTLCRFDETSLRVMQASEQLYTGIDGYLRLYGMLPIAELTARMSPMVKRFTGNEEGADEVLINVWRRRNGLYSMVMTGGGARGLWLVSPDLDDPEELLKTLNEPEVLVKPYASYDLEEAMACGRNGLPGRRDAYDEVLNLYSAHGVQREEAMDIVDSAITTCQRMEPEWAMDTLIEGLGRQPTPQQMHILGLVLLRTPMWPLKGSCAEELLPVSARLTRRVRQNDLCPCGSGKKYKNCCGRLQ